MDGLTLLSEGRAAGLTVTVDGDRLVIRGPKSADEVARRLLANKAVIMALLAAGNGNTNPAIPEVVPFDDLPLPGPACPKCGSLEEWTDLLGWQRCGVCEADTLEKALQLANRAARLRQQSQQRKPAPRIAPGCVSTVPVDTTTLAAIGLYRGSYRALMGVKMRKVELQKRATVCHPARIEKG
ncbi:MAG: hypothetical protein WCB27_01330 [Thermoguttaceae bacterium]